MLFSGSVSGITGMDTPGITQCTVNNGGFYVCNNSVEDMQYPSYSTGNGRDVVWEGAFPSPTSPPPTPFRISFPGLSFSLSFYVSECNVMERAVNHWQDVVGARCWWARCCCWGEMFVGKMLLFRRLAPLSSCALASEKGSMIRWGDASLADASLECKDSRMQLTLWNDGMTAKQ